MGKYVLPETTFIFKALFTIFCKTEKHIQSSMLFQMVIELTSEGIAFPTLFTDKFVITVPIFMPM